MAGVAVGPEIQTYDFPGGSSGEGTHTRPQQSMGEVILRTRGGDDSFEAPFDPDTFRQVLGHHAAGVVVITAATVEPVGFTATSFTSVSLYPPIVSFCVGRGSSSWSAMTSTAYLGVNLLSDGQADIARLFATRGADRFAAPVDWDADAYGVPVLDGVLASMICRRLHSVEVGDHAITLAEPLTGTHRVAADRSPLLYHRGRYTALVASAAAPLEGAHHGP